VKLLRLKLENFRQHRDSDIEFADGMTAIVGANGTGKTTILEAITFALYGEQRNVKDSIKFYWAEQRSRMRVLLEFQFEGRTYELERSTTSASLIDRTAVAPGDEARPAVVKATGLREVKSACERLLRLTYEQFKNSFCAEQKSLTFLQFNTDTRRQEQVAKMLGFDRLKLAADRARDRGRRFRGEEQGISQTIGDPVRLKSDVRDAKTELTSAKEAHRLALELGRALSEKLGPSEERKKAADEFFRLTQDANVFAGKAEALKSQRKMAEDAVAKSQADVKQRHDLKPAHDECLGLERRIQEWAALRDQELEREKTAAELSRLEIDIKSLTERMAPLEKTSAETARKEATDRGEAHAKASISLRQAEATRSKAVQAAQGVLSTAQSELKQAQQALARAQELVAKGICPECGQPTKGTFEEKLEGLADRVKAAEDRTSEAEAGFKATEAKPKPVFDAEDALDEALKKLEAARADLSEAEKCEAQVKALRQERDTKERTAAEHRAKLAKSTQLYDREAHVKAQSRFMELRPHRDQFLKLAGAEEAMLVATSMFTAASQEIEEARSAYRQLLAERAKLPFESAEQATEAIGEFEDLRARVAEAAGHEKHAEALAKMAEVRLSQAEARIKAYERDEANLREKRDQALLHETADKELKILREELNSVIRPELETRAGENLNLLTNGRYPILELDEEFNGTVVEDGVRKHVISGGEEDIVALSLRLALSELIQERQGRPMSLMILDEVFGGLDLDRRQAVLERLQAIKGRFNQILVISHIEEINQVADQCIFLTRDERTRSSVVGDPPLELNELVLTP